MLLRPRGIATFRGSHRFGPCDNISFSTASWPILACRSLISASLFPAFLTLSEATPVMPSITCRFHVPTCAGYNWRLSAISCTVLSPCRDSSATAAFSLSGKFCLFVIPVSIHPGRIHLGTLFKFTGPLRYEVGADFGHRQTSGGETNDLVFHAGDPGLALLDQLRLEAAIASRWHCYGRLAVLAPQTLLALPLG